MVVLVCQNVVSVVCLPFRDCLITTDSQKRQTVMHSKMLAYFFYHEAVQIRHSNYGEDLIQIILASGSLH